MQNTIQQIRNLIQSHENDLRNWIDFFESKKFSDNSQDNAKEFAIENTKKIYRDLIDELNKAISILEKNQQT